MPDTSQKGFSAILVIVLILTLSAAGFFIYFTSYKNQPLQESFNENAAKINTRQTQENPNEPPLKLKSIGVNLDYYDPKTKRAGDFEFTKEKLQFNRLFMGYGFVIPANTSSTNKDKSNPQPTFILPLGTPVRSLVDGVVANIPKVWSGDYSIQVTESGQLETWVYETEHVINPKVKVGDKVQAGQVIAEVSDFDKGAPRGFGTVEIGILKGGNPPSHICPFLYIDESIKDELLKKITAFFGEWEKYRGDTTLYDESLKNPGCLTLDSIEG